ncbi:MAG TPA: ABC transporter ATP-binding protein, partial [Pyrinomonadaceae bacterium]|nr:ABC transporter ATP-binding protein [Pyrinomonadaceae bacterium]
PAAIRVEAVSKQYRIYNRPADRLKETITRGRWKAHREFWALKDVSFEVEAGTTTGIIGPNGSGKSTLLQIITGTLEPTHGSVWLEGRVAALLELGAGFNPEFTGIENIFMNTALMGLSKSETESLLPEIASFAEIGDFIYQPLKTYSSGMYIRLAFAAAIAVSPQILIIDEALAVGDAVFQHRCTRRIKQMQESGTTILFVSHDPGAIRALCNRAILLNGGRMEADGAPSEVLNRYQKIIMARETAYAALGQSTPEQTTDTPELAEADFTNAPSYTFRHGNRDAEIVKVELLDSSRRKVQLVETGEQLFLRMYVVFHKAVEEPVFGFLIRNKHGIHLYGTNTDIQHAGIGPVNPGEVVEASFSFNCWLAPDNYSIAVAVHSVDAISFDWLDGALFFQTLSASPMEGVANLDGTASTRKIAKDRSYTSYRSYTL